MCVPNSIQICYSSILLLDQGSHLETLQFGTGEDRNRCVDTNFDRPNSETLQDRDMPTMMAPGSSFGITVTILCSNFGTPICLNPLGTVPKPGFLLPVSVHKPGDKYVEQDGEGISEGANEVDLGSRGIGARLPIADVANGVEEK